MIIMPRGEQLLKRQGFLTGVVPTDAEFARRLSPLALLEDDPEVMRRTFVDPMRHSMEEAFDIASYRLGKLWNGHMLRRLGSTGILLDAKRSVQGEESGGTESIRTVVMLSTANSGTIFEFQRQPDDVIWGAQTTSIIDLVPENSDTPTRGPEPITVHPIYPLIALRSISRLLAADA